MRGSGHREHASAHATPTTWHRNTGIHMCQLLYVAFQDARHSMPCGRRDPEHLEVVGTQAQLDLLPFVDVQAEQACHSPGVIHEVLRRHLAEASDCKSARQLYGDGVALVCPTPDGYTGRLGPWAAAAVSVNEVHHCNQGHQTV